MIDSQVLKEINLINTELKDLRDRLDKMQNKKEKSVGDSVRGSSKFFPYVEHNYTILGVENNLRDNKAKNKYKRMIKKKEQRLGKLINQIEYDLNNIKDIEMRIIFRYKYQDNLTNNEIAQKMNELNKYSTRYTEDSIRMKIKRFFEKK